MGEAGFILLNPFAISHGQAAVAHGVVARGFRVTPEVDAERGFPLGAHAVSRVAAEAAAAGIGGKGGAVEAGGEVVLVHPLR